MCSISYIIPHYESIKYLKILLNSIHCTENDEIIIIDDNSNVEVLKELDKLESLPSVKIIKQNENRGAGAARNLGIQNATKKWLIFADADDYFVENYRGKLDLYMDSDLDIIYFAPTSEKKSQNLSVIGNRHSYYEFLISEYSKHRNKKSMNLMKYQIVVPWSKMIRRSFVINNNIYYDEVLVSNDVMFSAKIGLLSKKIEATNEIIYCCVEHDESLTSDVSFRKTMDRLEIFKNQNEYLKANLASSDFKELNLTGTSYVIKSFRQKYSLSQKKEMISFFKKNKIKIINFRWIRDIVIRRFKMKELKN